MGHQLTEHAVSTQGLPKGLLFVGASAELGDVAGVWTEAAFFRHETRRRRITGGRCC